MSARYVGRGALLGYGPRVKINTATSTGTDLNNYGVNSFGSTAVKTWNLAAPVVGQSVTLYCNAGTGTAIQTVSRSGVTFLTGSGSAKSSLRFQRTGQQMELTGFTTASWLVRAKNLDEPITTVTSTAVALPTLGLVSFGSTAAKSWTLAAPEIGQSFVLYCNAGATGAVQKVLASTGTAVNFVSTGGSKNVAQFNKNNEILFCRVLTSAKILVSPNASIAYSTA